MYVINTYVELILELGSENGFFYSEMRICSSDAGHLKTFRIDSSNSNRTKPYRSVLQPNHPWIIIGYAHFNRLNPTTAINSNQLFYVVQQAMLQKSFDLESRQKFYQGAKKMSDNIGDKIRIYILKYGQVMAIFS